MQTTLRLMMAAFAAISLLATPASAFSFGKKSTEAVQTVEIITVPEQLITDLQEDFDLPESSAAAIVGNLAHESGNFRMLHEIQGTCYGYSQWCGSRKTAFRAFSKSRGGQQTYEANYGFLKHELATEYQPMLSRLRKTDSVDQAAKIFMKEFLRPRASTANLKRRVSFAKKYLEDDFSGAGCYSHFKLEAAHNPAPCPSVRLAQANS